MSLQSLLIDLMHPYVIYEIKKTFKL